MCTTDNIEKIVEDISITPNSTFLILDKEKRVVASNFMEMQGKNINTLDLKSNDKFEGNFNGRKCLIQFKQVPKLEWTVVSILPVNELTNDMVVIGSYGLAVGIAFIAILLFMGTVISRSITKPVSNLISFMQSVGERGIKDRLKIDYRNEVGILAKYTNKMLDNVDEITRRVVNTQSALYEAELEKKRIELAAKAFPLSCLAESNQPPFLM